MSDPQIIISEQCGSLGKIVHYFKSPGQNTITKSTPSETFGSSLRQTLLDVLRDVFLPHGYPESVSADYFDYQIWDTIQAFCSTITGTLTTRAILKGVGVGDAEATPAAAAITWVAKDGTGMLGRILFAWWKGNGLDGDCKKWRLFADFLNDGAMLLELLVPYVKDYSLQVLCATTSMKAIVGVAGSATRASITQHQAIKGNMADVSAKDGSQETFVNLVASIVGVFMLALLNDAQYEWMIFAALTIVHLAANYFAVKALVFSHLNNSRLAIILRTYLRYDAVPNPRNVNEKESVIVGLGMSFKNLCGFNIRVGNSLKSAVKHVSHSDLQKLTEVYRDKNYLLVSNVRKKTIYVALQKGETAEDVISSYYHAVLLGIALCVYNGIPLMTHSKRQLHHVTPVMRLNSMMKSQPKGETGNEDLPLSTLLAFEQFATQEIVMFFTALSVNGWNVDSHTLEVGSWRSEWKRKDIVYCRQGIRADGKND